MCSGFSPLRDSLDRYWIEQPVSTMEEPSNSPKRVLQDGVHTVRAEEHDRLLEVWEASVRATHQFLSESDIQFFKPLVLPELIGLDRLSCVRDEQGSLVGFVGIAGNRMEALFVHPDWHRAGIGRRLARYAAVEAGADLVDVNEQNHAAVAFYQHLGFQVEARSETDSTGKRFPLLHMRKLDPKVW